jgi:hypothetical protein
MDCIISEGRVWAYEGEAESMVIRFFSISTLDDKEVTLDDAELGAEPKLVGDGELLRSGVCAEGNIG